MEADNLMFDSSVNFMDFKLSKSEILRGIVTDKLTTAAREIFAVVERTVSGYEEEAAGLRQEIDRQRIQLEALLQPRVSLCRIDEPASKDEEEEGGDLQDEEERQTYVDGSESWDNFGRGEDEDEDEGEEESAEEPVKSTGLHHEYMGDPAYQRPSTSGLSLKRQRRTQAPIKLRVFLLQNSEANSISKCVLKFPVQEVRCPPGLQEADFSDLLRSTFPQLTGQFEVFAVNARRKLTPLKLQTLTPEEIQRSLRSAGRGESALYIREMARGNFLTSTEQLCPTYRKDNTSSGSHSSSLNSPVEGVESNASGHLFSNSGRQQQIKTEEDWEQCEISDDFIALLSARTAADRNHGDDDHEVEEELKPDIDEELKEMMPKPRSSRKTHVKCSGVKSKRRKQMESPLKASTDNSGVPLTCKVCKVLRGSKNMLIKHSWSHVEDPERLCGVCGEQSETPEELRSHLESHKKTYCCDICGKNFLSNRGLRSHAPLHTGEKPFKCDICKKAFAIEKTLKSHRLGHVEEKPHKCDVCNKSFAFQQQLRTHSRAHTGEKPYTCDLCGKSVSDFRSLSRHKMSHSGEKRYSCLVCGKSFLTPAGVNKHGKIHMDRHSMMFAAKCSTHEVS